MAFKLLKSTSNLEMIKETLGMYIENKSKQELLNTSLVFQSFNGYHINQFKSNESFAGLDVLLNFIKEKHKECSVNLIWNDLETTKKIYEHKLLNTLFLVTLPFINKDGDQSVSWVLENNIQDVSSLEVFTIDCSSSLLHIISL